MLRTRVSVVVFVCTLVASVTLYGQQPADKAYLGTWKLDPAKSTFEPGPGPKELTRVHEDAGGGQIRVTTKAVGANGTAGPATVYTYRADGQDNPITGGAPTGPTKIAIKRVDDYTVTYEQKLADGRVVTSGRRVLAKDGKTMTITATGTNAQGQKTSSTQVFTKQ
jgi:hypothetical protein